MSGSQDRSVQARDGQRLRESLDSGYQQQAAERQMEGIGHPFDSISR